MWPSTRQPGAIVAKGPITKPRCLRTWCGTVEAALAHVPPLQSNDVEVEHARAPAAAAPASELAFEAT